MVRRINARSGRGTTAIGKDWALEVSKDEGWGWREDPQTKGVPWVISPNHKASDRGIYFTLASIRYFAVVAVIFPASSSAIIWPSPRDFEYLSYISPS